MNYRRLFQMIACMKKKYSFINYIEEMFCNEILSSVNSDAVQNEHSFVRYFCTMQNIKVDEFSNVNALNISANTSVYDCNNFRRTRHEMSSSLIFISHFLGDYNTANVEQSLYYNLFYYPKVGI